MTLLTDTQLRAVITHRTCSNESAVAMAQELLDLRAAKADRFDFPMMRQVQSRRGQGGFGGHHR